MQVRWLRTILVASTAIVPLVSAADALAQEQRSARLQPVSYNIPSQSLTGALTAFARASGLKIAYPATLTQGRVAPALRGPYTRTGALEQLLAGSGLFWSYTGDNAVTISASSTRPEGAVAADGSNMLGPITVEGRSDGTNGIVSTRNDIGSKSNASILEVPQTVNVVTRKEMDARGVTDFNAVVAYTPGIRAVDYPGGTGSPDVYLRGFRAINLAALYRDGLRGGFNQWDTEIEQFAFDRIEVLKGPASVLYGEAAPGGLVNMTTKRPTETPLREVQTQYGSYNRKQIGVDFGGPVDEEGTFLYRLTGLLRDSGTQIDHSRDDRLYIAPALTWKPTDATSLTVMGNYQKTRKSGSQQSIPLDNSLYDNGIKLPSSLYLGVPGVDRYNVDNYSIGYEFKHEFDSGWAFNQNARYMRSDVDYVSSFIYDFPYRLYQGRYARIGAQNRPKSANTFQIDNNIGGRIDTGPLEHNLLFGLDYSKYDVEELRFNSSNQYSIDVLNPVYTAFRFNYLPRTVDIEGSASQLGLYAQDRIRWDNWVLTLGGRYDIVDTKTTYHLSRTLLARPDVTYDDQQRAFTGRVGLGYLFDNGFAPYLSYSTSFQPATESDVRGNPFNPTTGQQWEAGVKYQPVDWNGFVSASVFEIIQQNVTTADPVNIGYSVQDGEVRSRGFELEAKAELTDGLALTAGYAYTDSIVTKDNRNAAGISKVGTRLQSVPYHQASLWLDYQFQDEALLGLKIGGGLRYVGNSMAAVDTATGNQVKIPGYTLLDASVSYDFGAKNPDLKGLALAVSGTNLTDEKYFTPGFTPYSVLFGNRRAVNATLSYKW